METKIIRSYKEYNLVERLLEVEGQEPIWITGYTTKNGTWITMRNKYGRRPGLLKLILKHGIKPIKFSGFRGEQATIGFSAKEQKWYGWTHRCIHGFEIGHKVSYGHVCFLAANKKQFKKSLKLFFDKATKFEDVRGGVRVVSKSGLSHVERYPKKWGKGIWKAKSLADCKKMAIDLVRNTG